MRVNERLPELAFALFLTFAGCASADRPSRTDIGREPLHHRTGAPACVATRTSPEPVISASTTRADCTANAQCKDGRNGRCVVARSTASCVYDACTNAAECPGVAVCECADVNLCVASGCLKDADCGGGGYCSPSSCATGNGAPHFCHTTDDECIDDADCGAGGVNVCRYQPGSRTWRCMTNDCR